MKRSGTISVALLLIATVVWLRPLWRNAPSLDVHFEGLKPVPVGQGTNQMAVFRLANKGSATIYYEGTPFPVYIIEQKDHSGWTADGAMPEPEVLCPIFPGKNYKFAIPCPATSNQWRLAVSVLSPSRAPVLLRRYFKPRQLICRSPEVSTISDSGSHSMAVVEFPAEAAAR